MEGLTQAEAERRLQTVGPNLLEEKKKSLFLKFLGYFWGPIPWMIEVAVLLTLIERNYLEFSIIFLLLCFNATVGFFQEVKAANALESLKKNLTKQCRVFRDGVWRVMDVAFLVPGDVVRLRLGDIVPADVKLVEGEWLSIDQSTLTGESLPVSRTIGDSAYASSIIKQGEMLAVVTETGSQTFFGKTATLVESVKRVSHFQKAVIQIGDNLIRISLGLVLILTTVQLLRGDSFITLLQFVLVLVVASIPVAMPAVLSVTMALGALMLAKEKAIVSRLESIEELAGIDILLSDKTGTLTQNKLSVLSPSPAEGVTVDHLLALAALASKKENQDTIDEAIFQALANKEALKGYEEIKFTPFDPVRKRTEVLLLEKSSGKTLLVTKGAPQIILQLCPMDSAKKELFKKLIESFAEKGYRTLGVATKQGNDWLFQGLIPLQDPLRVDTVAVADRARELGIDLKICTGDNLAIAKEIGRQLHLGENSLPAKEVAILLEQEGVDKAARKIEEINIYAEVFPEHKFTVVKALQHLDHIVGMTGDGVNDAPALKQADIGIAVSGATEAARASADLTLTLPGLSVIISAIEEARRIFKRMTSYSIYRIAETIRVMFFIVSAILFYNFYPITAVMVTMLAILNDVPILMIAYDNAPSSKHPARWQMHSLLVVATVVGLVGVCSSFLLLFLAKSILHIPNETLQTIFFLKLIVAGHLTLFIARSEGYAFHKPYPSLKLTAAILLTQLIGILIAVSGFVIPPIPWSYVGWIWLYCTLWIFLLDFAKVTTYKILRWKS